jgi:hypothetical protein
MEAGLKMLGLLALMAVWLIAIGLALVAAGH